MFVLLLPGWMLALIALACAPGLGPSAQATTTQPVEETGILVGRVTRGPLSPGPVSPLEKYPPAPVPGVRVIISGSDGQELGSAVSDECGLYRISLLTGIHRVTLAPLGGREFTKDLPKTIAITKGQETRLDIHLDTGLR